MEPAVHDFGSSDAAAATTTLPPPEQSPTHSPAQQATSRLHAARSHSPVARENPSRDRRGSVISRMSSVSSTMSGMRHRRIARSNTVTTYTAPEQPNWQPGAEPGIDTKAASDDLPPHLAKLVAKCDINIVDFSDVGEPLHTKTDNAGLLEVLEDERPHNLPCRWISVNGLSWDVIRLLGNKYNLHRLAIEDLIHLHTRTKVDWYADHAFVVLTLQKLVRLHQHEGKGEKCDCPRSPEQEYEEKYPSTQIAGRQPANEQSHRGWWSRSNSAAQPDLLPRYFDQEATADKNLHGFVAAHSGVSQSSPIKPIRTLHRYESAQIPGHTVFMEKHSVLADEDLAVSVEQVSIFLLADNTVISFFEQSAEDIEIPIMDRLNSTETMLRRSCDASLLLQAIIDAIVDLAIPVRDAYNKARKELQVDAMTNPNIRTSRALHIFGEEIDMLQNLFKPIVHLVNAIRDHNSESLQSAPIPMSLPSYQEHQQDELNHHPRRSVARGDRSGAPVYQRKLSDFRRTSLMRSDATRSVTITPLAHTYFGDVLDHCITMIQAMEQMDASATNISTLIFNTVGARTNNFMMILAVVTVFFAPLTFISGYFGQNFASGHGLDHPFAFFWVVSIPVMAFFMLLVFATMLRDRIRDVLARRGIKAHWRKKPRYHHRV